MASDGARDRELHRYYQPWLETFHTYQSPTPRDHITSQRADGHVPQSSSDRALTAFAQLGALRLGLKRGLVTLIDSKNQYILAEATCSLSLMDDTRHAQGDELWLGNAVIPRSQGISQDVLDAKPYTARGPGDDEFTSRALVVGSTADDDRYSSSAWSGSGGIAFYAGVPLTTRLGHTIGVYNLTDNKPRGPLNASELRTMVDMAIIVVNHLDVIRNDRARARGERLVVGIGNFIEGNTDANFEDTAIEARRPMYSAQPEARPVERPKAVTARSHSFKGLTISDMNAAGRMAYSSATNDPVVTERTINHAVPIAEPPPPTDSTAAVSTPDQTPNPISKTKSQYLAVFERASKILRKCMSADGVIFVDASAANLSKGTSRRGITNNTKVSSTTTSIAHSMQKSSTFNDMHPDAPGIARALGLDYEMDDNDSYSSDNNPASVVDVSTSDQKRQFCELIAADCAERYNVHTPQLSEAHLRRLVRRYPQGRVCTFDSHGQVITSDESSESAAISDAGASVGSAGPRQPNKARSALLATIPDARTIVFLPVWDFVKERWNSAALVWSSNPAKLMNIQEDLAYLRAFAHSIMNEIARLNLAMSDSAKATFLANISHELRSPLHGILGSIEFLNDTPLDDFQSSMLISVETCSKSLLDVVTHVLDYSKLNNMSKATTRKKDGVIRATTSDNSLQSTFDLATVIEEAVEAQFAGQVFRSSNSDVHDTKKPPLTSTKRAMLKRNDIKDRLAQSQEDHASSICLTLSIDNNTDWRVISQPGAVRRVIMNLLGNSLKYTRSGSIDVALTVDSSRKQDDDNLLHTCITVIDTGIGMSSDFVTNNAFVAFSQENSLTSGTGLGLSIIRSIVDSLGGNISLRSQKDLGTEVKIWVSFAQPSKGSILLAPSEKSSLVEMKKLGEGLKLCMINPDADNANQSSHKNVIREMPGVEDAIRRLCEDWFSMEVFSSSSMDDVVTDFFIYAEPPPISYLLHHHGEHAVSGTELPVIILCQNAYQASALRANGLHEITDLGRILEIIPQPVGPQKLSKVLYRCMQRTKKLQQSRKHKSTEKVTLAVSKDEQAAAPLSKVRPQAGPRPSDSKDHLPSPELVSKASRRPEPPRHKTNLEEYKHAEDASRRWSFENSKQDMQSRQRSVDNEREDCASNAEGLTNIRLAGPTPIPTANINGKPDNTPDESLPRILIVDDNKINLSLLETMMRRAKHPYESARDGLQAFNAYKRSLESGQHFQYVLMDISMPVMDGVQATKEIRKWEYQSGIKSKVQIFALTGMGEQSSIKTDAKELGFDLFLSKPVKFKDLSALLV